MNGFLEIWAKGIIFSNKISGSVAIASNDGCSSIIHEVTDICPQSVLEMIQYSVRRSQCGNIWCFKTCIRQFVFKMLKNRIAKMKIIPSGLNSKIPLGISTPSFYAAAPDGDPGNPVKKHFDESPVCLMFVKSSIRTDTPNGTNL